jgi:4-diphosphocytidyl-2-C-methyl-D-erythritol kinase
VADGANAPVASPRSLPQLEHLPGGKLLARAPAKLNLSLRVLGRREDGYHELDSLVAKTTLYDELTLAPKPRGELELTCDCPAAGAAAQNLALRAARLLQAHIAAASPAGVPPPGACIDIRKRIAVGAGLGGGSSDAAAALLGLNVLWNAGLGQQELSRLALQLGSDVPLFLWGPASRMRGRGERLTDIRLPHFWALLVCPPFSCSTAQVYAAYDRQGPGRLQTPDPAALAALPVDQWPPLLPNDLLAAACRACPPLSAWMERMRQATGQGVHMTGSGSALFSLARDEATATIALNKLDRELSACAAVVCANPW